MCFSENKCNKARKMPTMLNIFTPMLCWCYPKEKIVMYSSPIARYENKIQLPEDQKRQVAIPAYPLRDCKVFCAGHKAWPVVSATTSTILCISAQKWTLLRSVGISAIKFVQLFSSCLYFVFFPRPFEFHLPNSAIKSTYISERSIGT